MAIEMAFESVDMSRPEAAKLREPGVKLLKWSGLQPIQAALRVNGGFDEACVFEDTKVLGDGGLGHAKLALDIADGLLGGSEKAEDGAAIGLGDDVESGLHGSFILFHVYTCQGIFKRKFEGVFAGDGLRLCGSEFKESW
jgi:hypothetical protein